MKVLVLFDRNGSYATTPVQWTETRVFDVTKGVTAEPKNALDYSMNPKPAKWPELNMGDPETLRQFVTWGRFTYPSDRTAVVVWDHGDGFRLAMERMINMAARSEWSSLQGELESFEGPSYRSSSHDETDDDKLYNLETENALKASNADCKAPIDVLGFDCCLMAMVETAFAVKECASVLVASQELEPGSGWQYDDWLLKLNKKPAMTPQQLGSMLVDSYKKACSTSATLYPTGTLSAMELSHSDAVATSISNLADELMKDLKSNSASVERARAKCQRYGDGKMNHIDLCVFTVELAKEFPSGAINSACQTLLKEVKSSIINRWAGPKRSGSGYESNGLAIYFPANGKQYAKDPWEDDGYKKGNPPGKFPIDFVDQHHWADFLHQYFVHRPG